MTTNKRLALDRAHLSTRHYDLVVTRKTLHIDAWLFQTPDDVLYFAILERIAGVHILTRNMYRVDGAQLTPVSWDDNVTNELQRRVDSKWARANYPQLARIHRDMILPAITAPLAKPFTRRSVRLHYVWTHPQCSDPMHGIQNDYGMTYLGQRYGLPDDTPASLRPEPAKLDAHTRSVFRTLDKLLKG